jgi:hypothetical protein
MNTAHFSIGDAAPPHIQEQAIEALAKEMHTDVEYVRSLYHAERARLESQAKIKTYLSVITTRLVRNALTQNAHSAVQ